MAFTKKPGTWLRDSLPTDEPFWLEKQLDELEDRIDLAFDQVGPPEGGGAGFTANVKDYGAVGNGVADDTTAITGAINDARDNGGGAVFFPGGTYVTDMQVIYDRVVLIGEGFANTTIKLASGADSDLIQSDGFVANYAAGGSTLGPYGFGLKDLTLDANYAGQTIGGYCYRVYGYGHRVQGVRFLGGIAGGAFSSWGTSGIATNMEAHWNDFTISECSGDGLHWEGPHDSVFSNAEIWTLAGGRVMDHCIITTGNSAGEKFSNVHTWGKQTVGWRAEKRISAVNCTGEGAYDTNVWLVAHQSYWHGDVYGTNANGSNNANETGIRFGDANLDNGTADCYVWANIFNFVAPCFPVDYAHSFGNRLEGVVRIPGGTRPTRLYKGTPVSEYARVTGSSNASVLELKLDPRPTSVELSKFTTKGDMVIATAGSTVTRLPVGADGTVPTADSTQASGLRWGLPNGATVTLGLNEIGASINGLSANVKYGSRFQVPGDLEIRTIQVPFDGLGAGSGTQKVKVVIHADVAGEPGALLATSDEVTITAGEAQSWRTFTLPANLALTTGYVWLGFIGGTTGGVARYSYTSGAGGAYVFATDTYSDGAASTFGAYTNVGNQLLNIRATSVAGTGTPGSLTGKDDGASQGTFDTLDAAAGLELTVVGSTAELAAPAIADHEARITAIEAGGGGGGIVTQVIDSGALTSGEVSTGPWIDTGASGGVFIAGAAKSSVAGVLYLEDSSDAATAVIRNQLSTSSIGGNHIANILAMTSQRYVRVRYVNGGTAATGFELVSGYSVTE